MPWIVARQLLNEAIPNWVLEKKINRERRPESNWSSSIRGIWLEDESGSPERSGLKRHESREYNHAFRFSARLLPRTMSEGGQVFGVFRS